MTGAVIALSLAVFSWSQSRLSDYNREFGETVDAEKARLKENLFFELIYYEDNPSRNLSIYLLNCGTIDGVQIQNVSIYYSNGSLCFEPFSEPPLYSFQSYYGNWTEISSLDRGEEGCLVLTLPDPGLSSGNYNVKIETVRGATFEKNFWP